MNVTLLDDDLDLVRTLPAFIEFAASGSHRVTVWQEHTKDVDVLSERLRDAEALVLLRERTPISATLLERLPRLKLITLNGPYPHVDLAACTRRGVLLCAGRPRPSSATAELTWGLIIAAARRIPQEAARLKQGHWQSTIGTGLRGRTLGILGYGTIGRQVAGFGKAFGMRVLVWSREKGLAAARADGHAPARSQDALFEEADVVSLHVRLVAGTRGMVSGSHLARMKPTALFVNTSRDALVEKGALVAALRAGRPGAAAVDVYETEPVADPAHPLLNMENVVCTPHLGYVERDQLDRYYADQFRRVRAFERGEPLDAVNAEVLQKREP
jgi:D-3-phosphoglycerate dehydrogenase / 2-oxoglutarate reductase